MSESQPSLFSSLSTIATRESVSRDSLVIGNLDSSSNLLEADVQPEHVVIDTGESDVSTLLKFVVASQRSTKSHKTSPVWQYFAHFDCTHHPDRKCYRICLICRDAGFDKAVSVGKDSSPAPLISHLRTHKEQYADFLVAVEKQKETSPSSGKAQSTMGKFFTAHSSVKERFKHKFARWVVEDSLPLTTCRSQAFKNMIRAANKTLDVPSYQTLMSFLETTKMGAVGKMKAFLQGKHFSITMDHWTSLATDNYGAITLHVIDDFKLLTFVLSCVKHDNGCTASEMERQLLLDMEQWGLDKKFFVTCITDSASNMNSFGERIDK